MPAQDRHGALFALLLLVPAPSVGVLAAMWFLPGWSGQAIYGFCKFWLVAFPLIWWLRVDREKVSGSPMRRGGLGFGVLSGLAIAAVIGGTYALLGSRLIEPELMREVVAEVGLLDRTTYIGFALYLTLVNSLFEEYVWRWFVYRKSEVLMGSGPAMIATALFFTLHHTLALFPQFGWGLTLLGSAGTFVGSLVWSWCYRRYGSIWPAYVSHVFADVAVFALGWDVLFG